MSERVLFDLMNHFSKQSHQLVLDTLDTCKHAGIGQRAAIAATVSSLILDAASGSVAAGLSPETFMVACAKAREAADQAYAEHDKATKKRRPR